MRTSDFNALPIVNYYNEANATLLAIHRAEQTGWLGQGPIEAVAVVAQTATIIENGYREGGPTRRHSLVLAER
jgi:hypothetical protein